ncbi:MAG: hypothetical protein AAGF11_55775 [Myxococcota bacterium]
MPADETPVSEPRSGAVLDPQWEVVLRAGQQAEGEQGSVEDELAVIHLLRHARSPESLDDAAFDRAWARIEADFEAQAVSSGWRAWLRRPWVWGGSAALAAAAAAVLVVVWSGPAPQLEPQLEQGGAGTQVARATPEGGEIGGMAATVEAQFAILEPGARKSVERSVDQGRNNLRGALVAAAIRAHSDGRTMGGAP